MQRRLFGMKHSNVSLDSKTCAPIGTNVAHEASSFRCSDGQASAQETWAYAISRMGELEPWIDENFVRSVWFNLGESVNVKMIRDKFSG